MTQRTQQTQEDDIDLMRDAMIATVDKVASRASTQDFLITLAIPMEQAPKYAPLLSKIGKHVGVVFADINEGTVLEDTARSKGKGRSQIGNKSNHAHGEYARSLFAAGFFRAPKLREALGLDGDKDQEAVAKELALSLGHESMGDVSPGELIGWAREQQLMWLLPRDMRRE